VGLFKGDDGRLGTQIFPSTARYSHLSGEETLETGAAISKKLYG